MPKLASEGRNADTCGVTASLVCSIFRPRCGLFRSVIPRLLTALIVVCALDACSQQKTALVSRRWPPDSPPLKIAEYQVPTPTNFPYAEVADFEAYFDY